MSRFSQSLTAVFEAYGDDAKAGLEAFANTDPPAWSAYVDAAAEKQYRADRSTYRRSLTLSVSTEAVKAKAGQARLFDPGESGERVEIRQVVVLDSQEYDIATLSGHDGSAIVRKVAERDLAPAATTLARCRFMLQLSDHVDTETERLGRDVTFAEVLGWAA